MAQAIGGVGFSAVLIMGLLLLVAVFAFGPIARTPLAGAIRAFVAFYLILLGLGLIFGPERQPPQVMWGALFGALGLSYFWITIRKSKGGWPSL